MDFTGRDLIGLLDAPKAVVQQMIPILLEDQEMRRRWAFTRKLRTFNTGEIADEIHEFHNATQGNFRLTHILFKKGRVIQFSLSPDRQPAA